MSVAADGRNRGRVATFAAPLGLSAPPPERTARRGAGIWAFLLAIVTAGALAHVGVRIRGLQVGYDLGTERRVAAELEEQRRRLQIEIGMLKDPGRVISIARERLDMGPPAPEAILRLAGMGPNGGPAPASVSAIPPAATGPGGSARTKAPVAGAPRRPR
ncbi:MAG: cell division protein FtsL [Bacteroidota bacterium]